MVSNTDVLDRNALASARQYMGGVAWPTVILGMVLGLSYVAAVAMALTGVLSLLLAVPLVAVLTYLNYTILHESVHGSISGNSQSLRWLNKTLGYMAAWILLIPLTAHRHEHVAHHRHTNDEPTDPDFHIGQMRNSLPAAARTAVHTAISQFSYYAKHRWAKAPARENVYLCLEVAVALIPRLAVFATGYWVEGLALFVLAWLIGATVLLYFFAYIVHRPHKQTGRYVDTSTILLPGLLRTPLTWFWMFQNYHSIHHLFPRVPFYKYEKLYEEIEDIMATKGAPIYRITLRGLELSSPGLAADIR
jgi:beta-carotene hydroxylase